MECGQERAFHFSTTGTVAHHHTFLLESHIQDMSQDVSFFCLPVAGDRARDLGAAVNPQTVSNKLAGSPSAKHKTPPHKTHPHRTASTRKQSFVNRRQPPPTADNRRQPPPTADYRRQPTCARPP
jgi:hypothetical protein